ncbi:MAG: flagellar motor switch protein FliG [Deltaproteobacteria bacterium]|nr:flagellar motor switch protein FliG [Deltaproteobacteria bacterium]MBW2305572.1 flagellar motor switch protein FliG [Deltaproteobacteria bacterium]
MIDVQKLTNSEKAAILLRFIGDEAAGKVLEKFSEAEIKKIAYHMSRMEKITSDMVKPVIEEFMNFVSSGNEAFQGGNEYVQKLLIGALGKDKADLILEDLLKTNHVEIVKKLKSMNPRTIASIFRGEHPQTIALILSHLDSTIAADVISLLPEEIQADVITRMCNLEGVNPEIIEDIAEVIMGELDMVSEVSSGLGGVKWVADVMNRMDRSTEENILSKIGENDQNLAQEIKQLMFIFDDLVKIDDRGIRELLKTVTTPELAKALKTADDAVKEKIFSNMSERAGEMLRDEMEVLGPTRLSDVEKAQQEILNVAIRLKEEGKIIVLEEKGDVIV